MRIYDYEDYKVFVTDIVASHPKGSRGMYRRMAESLRVHPPLLSQVFRGERNLTCEQAVDLAAFFELSDSEAEYLVLLVSFARAGSVRLQRLFRRRMTEIRNRRVGLSSTLDAPAP